MKMMFKTPLLLLLLHCATQTLGIQIQSDPPMSSDGVINTELEATVSLACMDGDGTVTEDTSDLVWLRNGAVVSLKEGNTKGRSSVCVSPVILKDNEATFTCHLSTNKTARSSVTLNVSYTPQLSGSEDITVEEEAELVLRCDIRANPPVSSVSWSLNGSAVDLLANELFVITDGLTSQLKASSVERNLHEGWYQCTAVSPKNETKSKIFIVTVTDKTIKFPLMPMVAGIVVVCLTTILAIVARWRKIAKCCK